MISLQETSNEYLLTIPAAQKERARGIQGRRWDPKRVCWVYPRTMRMYHALVSEFGDDLASESSFTPPQSIRGQEKWEDQELKELRQNVGRIEQTLSELLSFLNQADSERSEILMRQEREIQKLRDESHEKDEELTQLHKSIEQLQAENRRLYEETSAPFNADRDETVKEMASEVTGNHRVFGEYFRNISIEADLPQKLGNTLESHLKRLLDSDGSFYELIAECHDDQIFDSEYVDLAHALRKQRNIVAHLDKPENPRIARGRALFCLFGASLLFPELPETE